MIDLHNHILPGIDDGSKSIEESIEIVKNAYNAGVTDIVVTPHFILDSKYAASKEEKEELLDLLKKNLKKNKIPVKLYLGNEVFVEQNILELLDNELITTLNNSRYLLFELSLNNFYHGIYDLLFKLRSNGIIPILAHPERYSFIQNDPTIAFKLVEHGALLQSNIGSFYGYYGKRAKKIITLLIKKHAISFLSSDTHRSSDNYYNEYLNIKKDLSKIINKDYLEDLLTNNGKKVINDEIVETHITGIPKKNILGKWR